MTCISEEQEFIMSGVGAVFWVTPILLSALRLATAEFNWWFAMYPEPQEAVRERVTFL